MTERKLVWEAADLLTFSPKHCKLMVGLFQYIRFITRHEYVPHPGIAIYVKCKIESTYRKSNQDVAHPTEDDFQAHSYLLEQGWRRQRKAPAKIKELKRLIKTRVKPSTINKPQGIFKPLKRFSKTIALEVDDSLMISQEQPEVVREEIVEEGVVQEEDEEDEEDVPIIELQQHQETPATGPVDRCVLCPDPHPVSECPLVEAKRNRVFKSPERSSNQYENVLAERRSMPLLSLGECQAMVNEVYSSLQACTDRFQQAKVIFDLSLKYFAKFNDD